MSRAVTAHIYPERQGEEIEVEITASVRRDRGPECAGIYVEDIRAKDMDGNDFGLSDSELEQAEVAIMREIGWES